MVKKCFSIAKIILQVQEKTVQKQKFFSSLGMPRPEVTSLHATPFQISQCLLQSVFSLRTDSDDNFHTLAVVVSTRCLHLYRARAMTTASGDK